MQLPLSKMMRWKYFSGGRRGVNARMQVFMEPELSPPTVTRLGSPPNELEKEEKKKKREEEEKEKKEKEIVIVSSGQDTRLSTTKKRQRSFVLPYRM